MPNPNTHNDTIAMYRLNVRSVHLEPVEDCLHIEGHQAVRAIPDVFVQGGNLNSDMQGTLWGETDLPHDFDINFTTSTLLH